MVDYFIRLGWQNDDGSHIKDFDLAQKIRIGRHSDNEVMIVRSTLSRFQAEIDRFGRNIQLVNISETNPIQVITENSLETLGHDQSLILQKGYKIELHGVIVDILDLTAPGTGQTDPLVQSMVECPRCKRTLPASLDECPYDGWSLAAARTVFMKADDLGDTHE